MPGVDTPLILSLQPESDLPSLSHTRFFLEAVDQFYSFWQLFDFGHSPAAARVGPSHLVSAAGEKLSAAHTGKVLCGCVVGAPLHIFPMYIYMYM